MRDRGLGQKGISVLDRELKDFLNKYAAITFPRFMIGRRSCQREVTRRLSKHGGLQIKALLENVTNLRPDGEDFRWYIKLKCANCGEITEDFSYLTLTESSPLKGGRGSASMVIKCKLCGRENSIDIIRESIKPYHIEDSNKFKTVVVFDCRGCEPVEFSPRVGFAADGEEGGQEFTEVDLNELEWFDYDEKKNDSVGITEFESKFVSVK